MHDLIIIGAGPAGITAAVYAARKMINFLVISRDIGGQAALSGDVENYTGYQFITGVELARKFSEHMQRFGVEVREGEAVIEAKKAGKVFEVKTSKDTYQARTLLVASGRNSRMLEVPGEKEFKNRGVTYCATCDAPLFSGRDVAIIGGGNSALDAANQLIKIARKVYLVDINPALGGDSIMRKVVEESEKVTILNKTEVKEIQGKEMVTALVVEEKGAQKTIPLQGVFIEIGSLPQSSFLPGVKKNKLGEIVVDNFNRTNISGIFAAGDVTDVPGKQIIIAAGEGSKALISISEYLIHKGS